MGTFWKNIGDGPATRYAARFACGAKDMADILRLRCAAFGTDAADAFDADADHVLIEGRNGPVAAFRVNITGAKAARHGYTGQYYDLENLKATNGLLLELGRFCVAPGAGDPDILRLAWAELARLVDAHDVAMMFGCASFQGTDPAPYDHAFAMLCAQHQGPAALRPSCKATRVMPLKRTGFDPKRARAELPPLLRTYLAMGGWVSDHAVIDPGMNTLHVFTAVEIAAIPPMRKRLLRALV